MRGVKHDLGMLFTHKGRLTPNLDRPNTRGRPEQVLGDWEESEEGRGGLHGTPIISEWMGWLSCPNRA